MTLRDAPGAPEGLLRAGYARCASLTRAHGTTYWWGTQLLPRAQRRDVYAVYALCRLADDIVDEPEKLGLLDGRDAIGADLRSGSAAARLDAFEGWFRAALSDGTDEPVMAAVVDTVTRRDIPLHCFDRFFGAMRLDLVRESWASWPELRDGYMEGSAAVIGEMMLPVLEPVDPVAAFGPARALGLAFQLTNFLRDVGEDLDRGRVYLPADELAAYGVDVRERRVTPEWRAFLAAQIARNRELYAAAEPGIALLPGASGRCVAVAHRMYAQILDVIEAADDDVFTTRRRVSRVGKLRVLAREAVRPTRSGTTGPDR